MYSKKSVNSYARGTSPKRSYKRNIVLSPGVVSMAQSLLSGEVMTRAKDWAKGRGSKLAKSLKNPSKYYVILEKIGAPNQTIMTTEDKKQAKDFVKSKKG